MTTRATRARRSRSIAVASALTLMTAFLAALVSSTPSATGAVAADIERSKNVNLLTNVPKRSPLDTNYNSDIAFRGNYAYQGNYDGFTIWDISTPRSPRIVSQVLCPGGQGDISVSEDGSLLFFSVDYARSDDTCNSEPAGTADDGAWEGMRVFDISNPRSPEYVSAVRTDCGSHTHTLVPDKAGESVFLYVSSYGPSDRYPNCRPPHDSISIVEVPLDDPAAAEVVSKPVLFPGGGNSGTSGCHDITAYPDRDIAAGACMGDGILMDISDPSAPEVIDRVQDTNFAFWHSATFSNYGTKVVFTDELGGGGAPTCNAAVGPNRGANAIFHVTGAGSGRSLNFQSYYKIPRHQTNTENCVAHNGSLIPVRGRDLMVQAWYQGGVSVYDFTDSESPKEVGYFDRGPLDPNVLQLGGSWSAYFYNGHIYSSDIDKGLDVIKLRGQRNADQVRFEILNAQTQYEYPEVWGTQARAPRTTSGPAPVVVPGAPGEAARSMSAGKASRLPVALRRAAAARPNAADRSFMEMMVPHHHQAVLMSRLAGSRSSSEQIRALADRVRVEQGLEIISMKGWQARNGLPVTNEGPAYQALLNDREHLQHMGMATRAQMRALRGLSGSQFDARFLSLMIRHHQGAIMMAEEIGNSGRDTFIRQMSADMIASQQAQVATMRGLQSR